MSEFAEIIKTLESNIEKLFSKIDTLEKNNTILNRELNNSAQNQTHRLNVLFAYRYWKDVSPEFQTMPMDIPKQILFPQVPSIDNRNKSFVDTRSRQYSPFTGHLEDTPGSDLPISA